MAKCRCYTHFHQIETLILSTKSFRRHGGFFPNFSEFMVYAVISSALFFAQVISSAPTPVSCTIALLVSATMSQIASRLFLLLTLLLSTKLTVAQSLYSEFLNYNTSITTANATGIYELPGLLFGRDGLNVSTDPSQIWHLTQTIARRPSDLVTYGNSYLTIPSDQLPLSNSSLKAQYSACVRFFSVPDDLARTSQSQADDGSCSYILGADCVKDLKDLHLRQATAWANEEHTEAEFCTGYFDTIKVADYPSSCRNSSKEIFSGSQGAGSKSLSIMHLP